MLRLLKLELGKIFKPVITTTAILTVLTCILTCVLQRDYTVYFHIDAWEIGTEYIALLAPGAHSQFGSGKNTQFEPEQRANPFENVFSKTAVFPPPAIAETDL